MDRSYLHLRLPAQGSLAAAWDAVERAVHTAPGWAADGERPGHDGYRVWRHDDSGVALLAVAVGLDPLVLSIGREPPAAGGEDQGARRRREQDRALRVAVAAVRRAIPALGGREVADWELLPLVRQAQERLEWRALAEAGGGA